MSPSFGLRHGRAILVLALVLGGFVGVVDMGVFAYQRRAVLEQAETGLAEELAIVEPLVLTPLLQHRLSDVASLLTGWARSQGRIVSLKAVAPNGFAVVDHSRPAGGGETYGASREVRFEGEHLLTISVTEELGGEASRILRQTLLVLAGSAMLLVLVVGSVWMTVREIALRPLEQEIRRREQAEDGLRASRDELEVRVRERTAELAASKQVLESQNEQLKKLDVMKDGLIRDVTHELKTPVAKHLMELELLKGVIARHHLEGETDAIVGVMEGSIHRQQEVIRSILDLARLEGGEHRRQLLSVRLDSLAEAVLAEYAPSLAAHGITLRTSLEPVAAVVDRKMLWHVFSNIIGNAIKFRTTGGEASIAVRIRARDGAAVVEVEDNGIGLEPGERERIFERFYQASAAYEGSGVGMTIARRIVEEHGGTIRVDSEGRDKGTLVTVTLPLL